jgi:hypothetical protein
MKRAFFIVVLLLFVASAFRTIPTASSQSHAANRRRLELRVSPFADLYFFVYRLSSNPEKAPGIEGFAQSVEAARQLPMILTLLDVIPFELENSAATEKVFAQFPESHKTSKGEVIRLREQAMRFARSLGVVEKPFIDTIWPEHKLLIEKAAAGIELTLGPKEQECFDYLTHHLGMEKAEYIVPVYLVAETPWPGGFTMWGKDKSRGVCVLSVTTYQGSRLITALLHEAIHALDLETKGKGNVLVELRDRLLQAGFAADDEVVRHGPHMLVFIHSSETIRRHVDSSYQPYNEGIFVRSGIEPMVKVELPVWTAYLDGKISRDEALKQMVDAFVKARHTQPTPKVQPQEN